MFFKKREEEVIQPKVELKKMRVNEKEMLNEVLEHFINNKPKKLMNVQRGIESKESLLEEVEFFLKQKKVDGEQIANIQEQFGKFIWGYHILEDLINNPDISDIKVLGDKNVRIKRLGKRMTSDVKFADNDELKRFINLVAIKNQTNISDINAVQTFADKESNEKFILRFNISTEYVNSANNAYLHIRKIPKDKYTTDKLVELGLATREQMDFLINKVKKGEGIIFCGKGASGKTSLMNALIDEIPFDKSGLVIQENEELFSKKHPDLMFQRVRTSRGEGKIQYTLKDLAINGLLIDLDWFVIGEIKGGEALYFLNASYTGHSVMCSVHGISSTEGVNKLVDYMKYESDYTRTDLLRMVKSLGTVTFLKDFKIQEMSEIIGYDDTKKDLIYNMVFKGDKKINASTSEFAIEPKEVEKTKKDVDSDEIKKEIIKNREGGMSVKALAEKFDCSIYQINKVLKKG